MPAPAPPWPLTQPLVWVLALHGARWRPYPPGWGPRDALGLGVSHKMSRLFCKEGVILSSPPKCFTRVTSSRGEGGGAKINPHQSYRLLSINPRPPPCLLTPVLPRRDATKRRARLAHGRVVGSAGRAHRLPGSPGAAGCRGSRVRCGPIAPSLPIFHLVSFFCTLHTYSICIPS